MAVMTTIGTAIAGAVGATVTGAAATAIGVGATAAVVGGTAAAAYGIGKSKGKQSAARSMLLSGGSSDTASTDSVGDTSRKRTQALYSNDSEGVLGNATVGRRQLLAT